MATLLLGYNVDAWLVVKEESLQSALRVFGGTGVQITSVGHPYLCAALGFTSFINDFMQQHVIVDGLQGYHVCHHLPTPSLMLCILHLLMDIFLSETTIFAPIQVSQSCFLQLCIIIYFQSWFPMLLVTMNVSCPS